MEFVGYAVYMCEVHAIFVGYETQFRAQFYAQSRGAGSSWGKNGTPSNTRFRLLHTERDAATIAEAKAWERSPNRWYPRPGSTLYNDAIRDAW